MKELGSLTEGGLGGSGPCWGALPLGACWGVVGGARPEGLPVGGPIIHIHGNVLPRVLLCAAVACREQGLRGSSLDLSTSCRRCPSCLLPGRGGRARIAQHPSQALSIGHISRAGPPVPCHVEDCLAWVPPELHLGCTPAAAGVGAAAGVLQHPQLLRGLPC